MNEPVSDMARVRSGPWLINNSNTEYLNERVFKGGVLLPAGVRTVLGFAERISREADEVINLPEGRP